MAADQPANLDSGNGPGRLRVLRRYLGFVLPANLVWEFAQLPLYTIWETGSLGDLGFAALHCTVGDIVIAAGSLALALILAAPRAWPRSGYGRFAALTVAFGLAYTIFSEWFNVEVRGSWAYRDIMPVIPPIGTGLSPALQWIAIPLIGFRRARRPSVCVASAHERGSAG